MLWRSDSPPVASRETHSLYSSQRQGADFPPVAVFCTDTSIKRFMSLCLYVSKKDHRHRSKNQISYYSSHCLSSSFA